MHGLRLGHGNFFNIVCHVHAPFGLVCHWLHVCGVRALSWFGRMSLDGRRILVFADGASSCLPHCPSALSISSCQRARMRRTNTVVVSARFAVFGMYNRSFRRSYGSNKYGGRNSYSNFVRSGVSRFRYRTNRVYRGSGGRSSYQGRYARSSPYFSSRKSSKFPRRTYRRRGGVVSGKAVEQVVVRTVKKDSVRRSVPIRISLLIDAD